MSTRHTVLSLKRSSTVFPRVLSAITVSRPVTRVDTPRLAANRFKDVVHVIIKSSARRALTTRVYALRRRDVKRSNACKHARKTATISRYLLRRLEFPLRPVADAPFEQIFRFKRREFKYARPR